MQIRLNLKSVKNPDQIKLVGSLKINLVDFIDCNKVETKVKGVKPYELEFAKDKTILQLDLSLIEAGDSEMKLNELNKTQFKDT